MTHIYLLRHGETRPLPDRPPGEWPLSSRGEEQAQAIAALPFWAEVTAIYSSPEPKAVTTATPDARRWGLSIHLVEDLRELERPPGLLPDYEEAVAACFATPERAVGGWEPAAQVQRRMVRAISRLADAAVGRPIAVVSHGLALALFLAGLEGRPSPSLAEWRALPMSGWALLDLSAGRLVSPFSAPLP